MTNSGSESELMAGSTVNAESAAEVVADEQPVDPKLVPVSEAIRYRKRAQAAEETVGELQAELATVESNLRETASRMATVERAQEIDQQLVEAEVVDFDSARLLVDEALTEAGDAVEAGEVSAAVAEVRKRKPHLFRAAVADARAPVVTGDGVMGGAVRVRDRHGARPALTAATEALRSGRRQDVLRYMRLRRAGV